MIFRKDEYGSVITGGDMMKSYCHSDLDTVAFCLKLIRGRMMGISWNDLSKRFGKDPKELHEMCSVYLGDVVADYDYDRNNGLPEKYSDLFNQGLSNISMKAMDNDVIGHMIPYNDFIEYSDEIAIDKYIRSWEKNFGLKWKDFIREYKDKQPDEKYDLQSDGCEEHGFSFFSLLDDYRTYGNDHLSPGHGSWKYRMPYEEDQRYPESFGKDKYGLPRGSVRSFGQ